jgi:2-phosphoglycerate kinase
MVDQVHPPPSEDGPPVVLLGGVSGTGKTTIANALVRELGLTHHISTGFIRAAITHLLPEDQARLLGRHSYDAYQALGTTSSKGRTPVLQGAIEQSLLLRAGIEACISRAVREGIGVILEGSHFIPGVLDPASLGATVLCVLDVPDRRELKRRALSPNHTRRRLSDEQLARLVALQEEVLELARVHGQPVVINEDLGKAVSRIRGLIEAAKGEGAAERGPTPLPSAPQ